MKNFTFLLMSGLIFLASCNTDIYRSVEEDSLKKFPQDVPSTWFHQIHSFDSLGLSTEEKSYLEVRFAQSQSSNLMYCPSDETFAIGDIIIYRKDIPLLISKKIE